MSFGLEVFGIIEVSDCPEAAPGRAASRLAWPQA